MQATGFSPEKHPQGGAEVYPGTSPLGVQGNLASEQEGHFDEEGRYVLTIPYSNDTELVMDVMRYGAGVEVLSPNVLRQKAGDSIRQALLQYENK